MEIFTGNFMRLQKRELNWTLHSKTLPKSPLNILDISSVFALYSCSIHKISFLISPTFLNYSFICSPSEVTTELTVQFASPLSAMISKTKILPWDSSSLVNIFCHDHLLQCLLVSRKHQGYSHTINLPLCSISNTVKSTYVLVPFPLTILFFPFKSTVHEKEDKKKR